MTSLSEIILKIVEEKCYEINNAKHSKDHEGTCNAVFDGYYCWPDTEPGVLAFQPCSNNILKTTKQVSIKYKIYIKFVSVIIAFCLNKFIFFEHKVVRIKKLKTILLYGYNSVAINFFDTSITTLLLLIYIV